MLTGPGGGRCGLLLMPLLLYLNKSYPFQVKVSQIPCGAIYAPPPGCLQYHTGVSGVVKSFNYDAPSSEASTYAHSKNTCIFFVNFYPFPVCPSERPILHDLPPPRTGDVSGKIHPRGRTLRIQAEQGSGKPEGQVWPE